MQKSSWLALALLVLLILGAATTRLLHTERVSEEEQIRSLLSKAQTSVEKKSLRGALSCLSKHYSDESGNTLDTMRLLALKGFRTPGQVHVSLGDAEVAVSDGNATVETTLTVSELSGDVGKYDLFSGHVKMALEKEKTHKWLLFPDYQWKITSISGLPAPGGM